MRPSLPPYPQNACNLAASHIRGIAGPNSTVEYFIAVYYLSSRIVGTTLRDELPLTQTQTLFSCSPMEPKYHRLQPKTKQIPVELIANIIRIVADGNSQSNRPHFWTFSTLAAGSLVSRTWNFRVLRSQLTTQTTTTERESKLFKFGLSLAMAQLLKTPPEVSLRIAGYLPKQRDCLALSLVARNLRGLGEQALYSNIVLRLKHDAATDNIVELFYHAIKANQGRRDWVRSLSVIALRHTFTSRERKLIHRILCMLPRLINFSFEYPPVDVVDGNPFDLRRCFSYSAPLKSSLRTFTWLHAEILDERAFKSFLSYHSNIKYLAFDEDAFDVPKIGSQALPNLESLRAPIDAVLRMLPKRRVQRIKTVINRNTPPDWKLMRDKHFESIRVFSATIHRNDDVMAQALLDSLIRRMLHMFVKDETAIVSLTLKNTKIKFLRLRNLRNELLIEWFFDELPLLECIEVKFHRNSPMNRFSERFYGDGRRSRTILWECMPNEEWLHDWRDVVIIHPYTNIPQSHIEDPYLLQRSMTSAQLL
ncbi:hypothetical protein PTI98_009567 [Pleurotus ostreatus]|nr:hypothetical protein PTI98_009567 [Pleurotus ostreatus]